MVSQPHVSVILPTSRKFSQIEASVRSILNVLDFARADFTIVFNGVVPAHPLPSFCNKIKVVFESTCGLLAGRHRGLAESQGSICTFVDDDIEVGPNWFRAIVNAFEDPAVALVGGPSAPRYASQPPEWINGFWHQDLVGNRWCTYLSLLEYGDSPCEIDPHLIWGLNFSIRRNVVQRLGGFHPDGVPWALRKFRGDGETAVASAAKKCGLRCLYRPDARVEHQVPAERLTLDYFCKRAYFQGVSDSYTQLRNHHLKYSVAKRLLIGYKQKLRHLRKRFLSTSVSTLGLEQSKVQQAYREGFNYHQQEFAEDSALRRWVLKPDYWDYAYPQNEEITKCA